MAAFAEECGITEEQACRLGSCMGTGMRKGEVCGAVTGALMVLGLLYGQKKAGDTEGCQKSNEVNDLMMNRFKKNAVRIFAMIYLAAMFPPKKAFSIVLITNCLLNSVQRW